MRKTLKKAVALALVCAMTLPSALVASAAPADQPTLNGNPDQATSSNDITISGNAVVDTTTYHVVLPADLDFAVDQYNVAGNGQIYGVSYPIMNASDLAVKVTVTVSDNSANANLVDSITDDALMSESANNVAYIAAIVPKSLNIDSVSAGNISANTISGNYAGSENTFAVTAGSPTEFGFKLAKYDTENAPVLSSNNCATFSWTGKVNSATAWADGDISVKATFKMTGLSPDTEATIVADADNNLIAGGGGGSSTTGVFDRSQAAPVTYNLALPTGVTVSGITVVGTGSNNTVRVYNYASFGTYSNGVLTLKADCPALKTGGWPADTYAVNVALSDSTSRQLTLVIK